MECHNNKAIKLERKYSDEESSSHSEEYYDPFDEHRNRMKKHKNDKFSIN